MAGDPRAICAECGHVRSWHDREAARSMTSGELASDRRCYREVGGAGCRCGGFRDSGEVATLAMPLRASPSVFVRGVLTLLLVAVGLALLYANRSQSPSAQAINYTQAVQAINASQVTRVTIVANQATLELQSGAKQVVTLPEPPFAFQKVLDDYNAANPSRPIMYEYQQESTGFAVIGSIFLSLLPIVLLGAGFLYLMSSLQPR